MTARRVPTIIEAMESAALFGPFYSGASWAPWKAVLKAAFGLEMTAQEIILFKTIAGDRDPPGKRCKELVLAIGRRGGKDAISALIGAYMALTFQPAGRVRAGERPLILLLAKDQSQARNLLRFIRGLFDGVPALKKLIQRSTQDGFELRNSIDIAVGASDYRTVRGRTILCCIMNEIAFWNDAETSANPSQEVYRAIKPSMATLADDAMLVMISSVHRRAGLLYDRWQKFYGISDQNTLVIWAKTRQLNPTIDEQVVVDALADDPQSGASEYDSIWRDDLASYVTRPEIEACILDSMTVRPPQPGIQYVSRIDASSGLGKDSTTACIGHMEGDIGVIDCIVEIRPPFSPPDAVAQVAAVLRSYNNISPTTGDRWGLNFVASEFARHNITLEYNDKNRSDIYREALPIIRSGRARLLANERMVNQFINLERRALPGGGERIDHPQRGGCHDDVCQVVSAVLVALASPLTGAAGWLEYMRKQCEAAGVLDLPFGTDVDPVRMPGDWNFSTAALVLVALPPVIANEGRMPGMRWREGKAFAEMTRAEAIERLRHPAWRSLNEELARELLGETA
jgi:hypothetical protein